MSEALLPDSNGFDEEAFRQETRAFLDWIASYLARVEEFPVRSAVAPGALRTALPAQAPEHPEPVSALIEDLEKLILPGITHWQSPNFFAYFPANASGPAVLGELHSLMKMFLDSKRELYEKVCAKYGVESAA